MTTFVRRWGRPIAVVAHAAYLFALVPIRVAHADPEPAAPPTGVVERPPGIVDENAPKPERPAEPAPKEVERGAAPPPPAPEALPPTAPVTGGDKTGVSSQAISVPQGAGKIQGMGESFSAQLSTGVGSFTVPFSLPDARGGAQPSLSLSYSSGGGLGVAGIGWEVGVPFIARQTDRGLPLYQDPSGGWRATQDRFVFNGGQELVPICLVTSTSCSGAPNEVMPPWAAAGWQYFRARVEGSYLRFFWSPDHRTWRVQSKSGETMELGAPLDGSDASALEADPQDGTRIFRWNLARQYDAVGAPNATPPAPVNTVVYRYKNESGVGYLTDIYMTPPASSPTTASLDSYEHHVRLTYEVRPDPTSNYRRGWRVDERLRLTTVDVATKTFTGASAPRRMVRRYHLAYDSAYHVSLLASVQLEGRCGTTEDQSVAEDHGGGLPPTNCPRLPAMAFGYQHVAPYKSDGSAGAADLPGYEGFDERVHAMASSPPYSLDEDQTDLFDINGDGLPDVMTTMPGFFGGKFGLFLNGDGGKADAFGQSTIGVAGVNGEDVNTITLANENVSVSDLDGDGIIDLLHMPQVKTYSVYTPAQQNGAWMLLGRSITTASGLSPKIDFGGDAPNVRVMDVNGDGLVDVVVSTGTELETFFALGRYPGGDGQYGHATWTSATTASLSNDPVASCLPWAGLPFSFSDSTFKIADMNGDGLADLVRVLPGSIRYWPGRGNGYWGTGDPRSCPAGGFGQSTDIAMANSPQYSDPSGSSLRLDDVNGDGLDDLVQVRFTDVDVWLNVDGAGWTPNRHTIANTPPAPGYTSRVRLADANGSGTRDLLWGDSSAYKYIDLLGGSRPWVLTHVQNGLGKTTDIEYASSTELMLAAQAAGHEWSSKAPMPLHVVRRVTDRDNLQLAGRSGGAYVTEYTYADPVYDGRQREFRGFRTATARRVGDANSPTSLTTSTFLLGECKDDAPVAGLPSPCTPAGRWRDNVREALKGLPLVSDVYDESQPATHLSTEHHTYRLRRLYEGLDGREVRVAFESASDAYAYDTAPFTAAPEGASLTDVELETTLGTVQPDTAGSVTLWARTGRAHTRSSSEVDIFGNATSQTAFGCVDGCATGDEAITTVTTPGRPAGDTSGWMWRTVEQYVTGASAPGVRWKDTTTSYDAFGNPLVTSAVVQGTLALDRFHADPSKQVAPPPQLASLDGTRVLETRGYGGVGNLTSDTGANQRCRQIIYANDYEDLAVGETVFAGKVSGACGDVPLTASAAYDRGLAAAVRVYDIHGELTTIDYDAFGRLKQTAKPSPTDIGSASGTQSVMIDYTLPPDALPGQPPSIPYSIVHTQTQDGDSSYRSAWAYVDGLGRTVVTIADADTTAGDAAPYYASGLADYDAKGAARRAYRPWFWNGDPMHFPLSMTPPTSYGSQRYDAFGRQVQTYGLDGAVTLQSAYHALGVDQWDAADLEPGPHQGTYASTLSDGHGRTIKATERIHVNGRIELHDTNTTYTAIGTPLLITRTGGGPTVTRWLRYDSLGRMVLNVEPDTTKNFSADPTTPPEAMKAWRYAYDDNGDLVGTSDARGCGSNYFYDAAGRITAEDYSPCETTHEDYSAPDFVANTGIEVLYHYDSLDSPHQIQDCAINPALLSGRLVSVSDRAEKSVTSYDGRGRVTCIAKQVAKPGTPSTALATRYAPRWYTQTARYDAADRPVQQSTGAVALGSSFVTTAYAKSGHVKSVSSSYGDLVTSITRDSDGVVEQIVYGDVAKTTTAFSYDQRRRLSSVQTYRGPPAIWTAQPSAYSPAPSWGGAPSTLQLLLEDTDYVYDSVDNPTEIRDWRTPDEWPAGAKPVTRKMQYDDLYRLTRIDYTYSSGDDPWTDPFAAEDQGETDTRRAKPSPHVSFDKRVLWQTFQYDALGNTVATDDDAKGFYDRSLGTIVNGTATSGPYQLKNAGGVGGARGGSLSTMYDDAGNLVSLAVARSGPCLPAGAVCGQRFVYDWDEVGRLVRARRWDTNDPTAAVDPSVAPAASLAYAYDASDSRVLKGAYDAQGNAVYTVYALSSLELRRAAFDGTDYIDDTSTEVPYLQAHGVRLARVHYAESDVPALASGRTHVLLELADHLGSSEVVIDRDTSELVERSTYQAYGAAESDYRPERWGAYRDDYRFTGKEEDVEVGLQYFGKRFYVPVLGRWVSADPLNVHGLGADPNAYAYVHAWAFNAIDPSGLDLSSDVVAKARSLGNSARSGDVASDGQGTMEEGQQTASPAADVTAGSSGANSTAPASNAGAVFAYRLSRSAFMAAERKSIANVEAFAPGAGLLMLAGAARRVGAGARRGGVLGGLLATNDLLVQSGLIWQAGVSFVDLQKAIRSRDPEKLGESGLQGAYVGLSMAATVVGGENSGGGSATELGPSALAVHNRYLNFVRPGATGTAMSPSWAAGSLGTRILDDFAVIDGQRVGFEANTTPWALMTEQKFAHKMDQAAADFALMREGKVDRMIWFGTEPLPTSGLGGQLARALKESGIEYWWVPPAPK